MAEKLQFELVSPEKLLLSEAVALGVVHDGEGNFGVLPGHALLISTVRPGVIDVYGDAATEVSERIFVSGGFAEVTPERCTVLADGRCRSPRSTAPSLRSTRRRSRRASPASRTRRRGSRAASATPRSPMSARPSAASP